MLNPVYKVLKNQHFLNPEGIKLFAERSMNSHVSRAAIKNANVLTSYVKVLKEERSRKKDAFLECTKADRMDDGSFSIMRKKSRRLKIVVYIAILFEIFLNYISTLIFIQGEGLLFVLVRWGLAIVLALAAMLVTDGLLSKLLPEESVRIKGRESNITDDDFYKKRATSKRVIGLVVLPLTLVAVEWAIVGVARARAMDIEGGQSGGVLYYGFILLSMALPVIAGYFKWDSEQHGKLYQNTLNYYKIQKLLHILNLSITATMKDVKDVVENSTRKAWQVFERFKLYKENYNLKRNVPKENIDSHYCVRSASFAGEAINRFGEDVKLILKELQGDQK